MSDALTDSNVPAEASDLPAEVMRTFDLVYDEHFDFVWRSLARLGVTPSALDDAAQDVFMVVHRKLTEYDGAGHVRSWLFAISMRVASDYRRRIARRGGVHATLDDLPHTSAKGHSPEELAARQQAREVVAEFLESLDEDKRLVFVLMELEQMTAKEVAQELGLEQRAVYSKSETAKKAFENFVARYTRRRT